MSPKVYQHILQSKPAATYDEVLAIAQNFELADRRSFEGGAWAEKSYGASALQVFTGHVEQPPLKSPEQQKINRL